MNKELFQHAKKILDEMSVDELEAKLVDAGFNVTRKSAMENIASPKDWEYNPEFKSELRLYAFVNFYLSSIQQGIQTGHAAVALVRKYTDADAIRFGSPTLTDMVVDWADNHKTFITLNGGHNAALKNILALVEETDFAWCEFREDEDSLGGILTTVAVVLPDNIFNLRRTTNIRDEVYYTWTRELPDGGCIIYTYGKDDPEFKFIEVLKSCNLAK